MSRGRILLDSHVAVWALIASNKIGKKAWQALRSGAEIQLSAVSIAELKMKALAQRLRLPVDAFDGLEEHGFAVVGFDFDHAQALQRFGSLVNHDPFDRMILAQAAASGSTLMTADARILELGLDFVVDATE
jgi:PIN domain nuclease of toxin-antitoxin system